MNMAAAICAQKARMKKRRMWRGGDVAPDRQADDLHVEKTLVTSGEPHTYGMDEEEHPMEFMADGGEIEDFEDDEEYMPGATTRDVRPEAMPSMAGRFHHALKRRQRRFG